MSPDALLKGSVILSAYGEKYYAFVFAPSLVVIYSLSAKAVVYKQSFAEEFKKLACHFTSLVTFSNKFYAGLSDGGILLFLVQKKKGKRRCKYIDSRDDGLTGYGAFRSDPSKKEIKLLACDNRLLVYSTEQNELVLLRPEGKPERISFAYPILKLRINGDKKMLLLVTKEETRFFLYKVPIEECWSVHSRSLLDPEGSDWQLMGLSINADVAFQNWGEFLIYKPFSDEIVRGNIQMGNSDENKLGSLACFVGKDERWFAYCGDEYAEIALACCSEDGKWEERYTIEEHDLEEYKISKKHKLVWGESTIKDVQFGGKNLVARIQDGLVSFAWSAENRQLLDVQPTYLPLAFGG